MNKKEINFDLATLFRVIGEKEMIVIKQNMVISELEEEISKLREFIRFKTEESNG